MEETGKKKIQVNASSLVDLKAELIRKQQEAKQERQRNNSNVTRPKPVQKKPSIWSQKNAGVLERAQRDFEERQEEIDTLTKSRNALEKKTKLYEKMTQGKIIPDEDGSQLYLVDFEKKAIDKFWEKRESDRKQAEEEERKKKEDERQKEEEAERKLLEEAVPPPDNPAEEWVDYTDSLGRSRRCMKKDLPGLIKMDEKLGHKQSSNMQSDKGEERKDLMSHDMYREMLREKWEKEELEALSKPAGPVHYANVQFDEIRTHGVGYYQFNKDEATRQEQMSALHSLREQTLDQRQRMEKLKEKRKAIMAARLAKVRQRKMVQDGKGLAEEIAPGSGDQENDDDDIIGPKLSEKHDNQSEPELLLRDDSWREKAPLREWDKGKTELPGGMWGVRKDPREERPEEFAPPQEYYEPTAVPSFKDKRKPWKKPENHTSVEHNLTSRNKLLWKKPEKRVPGNDIYASKTEISDKKPNSHVNERKDNYSVPTDTVESNIHANLSAIRAQVDQKRDTAGIDLCVGKVADIPLPMEPPGGKGLEHKSIFPAGETVACHATVMNNNQILGSFYPQQQTGMECYEQPVDAAFYPGMQVNPGWSQGCTQDFYGAENVYSGSVTTQSVSIGTGQSTCQMPPPSVPPPPPPPPPMDTQPVQCNQQSTQESNVTTEDATKATLTKGPQPAHYSSAPMKPQPKKPRFERVDLHNVPLTLPAPPTAGNVPEYPSQEEIHTKKKSNSEQAQINYWQKQYGKATSKSIAEPGSKLRPANIPFPSPYVQKKDDAEEPFPVVDFDPSQPPPNLHKNCKT